jgi:Porin-like glycoporin RafY
MKTSTTFALRATAAAALLGLASTAFALETSANIELDNTYRTGTATKVTNTSTGVISAGPDAGLTQSGRVELNVTGKVGSKYFVAGKAAILAKKDGTAATDDMWIQLGSEAGDVKLGRFEAADLFPLAQDTVVNNVGTGAYGTNFLRGRKAANVFHAAGTVNFAKGVGIEVGVIETKISGEAKGIRPVFFVDSGPLSIKVGAEVGKFAVTGAKLRGFGGTVGYDFGGFKITGNAAAGKVTPSGGTSAKVNAFGITGQAGPAVLGLILNTNDFGGGTKEKATTFYASYSLPLFDIKGATVTPALSASKAKDVGGVAGASVKDTSFRLRFNYTF